MKCYAFVEDRKCAEALNYAQNFCNIRKYSTVLYKNQGIFAIHCLLLCALCTMEAGALGSQRFTNFSCTIRSGISVFSCGQTEM